MPATSKEAQRLLGHVTALQKLPYNCLQARPAASLAAVAMQPSSSLTHSMRHPPRLSSKATFTEATTSAVVPWPRPQRRPPPLPLRLLSAATSLTAACAPTSTEDVLHGYHVISPVVAGRLSSFPHSLVCNHMPTTVPHGYVHGGDSTVAVPWPHP